MGFKEPKKGNNIGPDTNNYHSNSGTGKYNDNPYLGKPFSKKPLPEERYEQYTDLHEPTVIDMVKERNKFFSLGRGPICGEPTSVTTDTQYPKKFQLKPVAPDVYTEGKEED